MATASSSHRDQEDSVCRTDSFRPYAIVGLPRARSEEAVAHAQRSHALERSLRSESLESMLGSSCDFSISEEEEEDPYANPQELRDSGRAERVTKQGMTSSQNTSLLGCVSAKQTIFTWRIDQQRVSVTESDSAAKERLLLFTA